MQAKLNEIIVALDNARNELVGLEHRTPEHIDSELKSIVARASEVRTTDGER
jgi:low affinity Fe/Cu permease